MQRPHVALAHSRPCRRSATCRSVSRHGVWECASGVRDATGERSVSLAKISGNTPDILRITLSRYLAIAESDRTDALILGSARGFNATARVDRNLTQPFSPLRSHMEPPLIERADSDWPKRASARADLREAHPARAHGHRRGLQNAVQRLHRPMP